MEAKLIEGIGWVSGDFMHEVIIPHLYKIVLSQLPVGGTVSLESVVFALKSKGLYLEDGFLRGALGYWELKGLVRFPAEGKVLRLK
jgi:hypothetical protein